MVLGAWRHGVIADPIIIIMAATPVRVTTDAKGRVTAVADARGVPIAYVVVRTANDRPALGEASIEGERSGATISRFTMPVCAHCGLAEASVHCGQCMSADAVYCGVKCAAEAWNAGHYATCCNYKV